MKPLIPFAIILRICASSLATENPRMVVSLDGEWQIVFDRANEGRAKTGGFSSASNRPSP
jgi:hypothetical protein